jgi:hypothetical protein
MTENFIDGETTMRLDDPCRGTVATPFPLPWMLDRLGPDRIQDHTIMFVLALGVAISVESFPGFDSRYLQ